MTAALRRTPASSRPVPRPVTSRGRAAEERGDDRARRRSCCRCPSRRRRAGRSRRAMSSAAIAPPDLDRGERLGRRHRGLDREVAGPGGDPGGDDAGPSGGRSRRRGIGSPATPTSTTTRSAPAARLRTLIAAPPAAKFATIWRGDLGRIRRHPLARDPVIAGEDSDRRAPDRGDGLPPDARHLDRQRLEPPETPRRLRQSVEATGGRRHRVGVERPDRARSASRAGRASIAVAGAPVMPPPMSTSGGRAGRRRPPGAGRPGSVPGGTRPGVRLDEDGEQGVEERAVATRRRPARRPRPIGSAPRPAAPGRQPRPTTRRRASRSGRRGRSRRRPRLARRDLPPGEALDTADVDLDELGRRSTTAMPAAAADRAARWIGPVGPGWIG